MKKKIILFGSLTAFSLVAVSLTSCGGYNTGNVKNVTPEVLETTLVENSSTNSKAYKSLLLSNSQSYNNYLIDTAENKITNLITGKSISVTNLSQYDVDTQSVYYGNGNTYLLKLQKYESGTYHVTYYDNSLDIVATFDTSYSYVYFDETDYKNETIDDVKYYYVTIQINYADSDMQTQTKTFDLEVNNVTKVAKLKSQSTTSTKDFNKRNYYEIINGYYYTLDRVGENNVIKAFDSSYNELGELTTSVDIDFFEYFNGKFYLQGSKDVPETYKNVITYYNAYKNEYSYKEVKTYLIDVDKKKVNEIDTEVIFTETTCDGKKDSDYFVTNYYELKDNFYSNYITYTGFFKNGELEYKLPVNINSVKTGIKKIDDNYLISDGNTSYLYDKDMNLVKSGISVNEYGFYSDNYNFKTNYYDAAGKVIYSTENIVDDSNLSNYGYVEEYNSDFEISKLLVFKDGKVETINVNENMNIDKGFIITKDSTNAEKYTIKQIGGTASVTVYSSGNIYLTSDDTDCYYLNGGVTYSDAEKTKEVHYMYCLK